MSRKNRVSNTFPRIPPYRLVGDYLHSKNNEAGIQFKKYEWDKPGHDPVFHLLAAQRVLHDTTENLRVRREWAKDDRKILEMQWNDLFEQEMKFKEQFKMLSSFVKSNSEKRTRAEHNIKEYKELNKSRALENDTLRKKIELIFEAKKKFDTNINSLSPYVKYLNEVAGESEDYINADDLISRYEALVNTRSILANRQQNSLRELELARARTSKMIEENRFKILGLNNIVADLNARYNTAFRQSLHWESIVLAIRRHSYEKYGEITEVKQACWNNYQMMCKRKGEVPKLVEDDFENQLIYIKKTLQELETVKSLTKLGESNNSRVKVSLTKKKTTRRK